MTLYDFKDLIRNLPTKEQSFTTKRTTWNKPEFTINKDFNQFVKESFKTETLQISRQDCFDANQNFSELLFKSILWGYPSGMRGKTFQRILNNYKVIKKSFDDCIQEDIILTRSNFEKLEKLLRSTGIGLSTLTKLLYFKKIDIDNYNALIFDSRIIEVLNTGKFVEFSHLINAKKDTLSCYNFLVSVRDLQNFDCDSEQVEHFLFTFGLNLKQ